MFTPIHGDTFNELALNSYANLLTAREQPSRNGPIKCINNAVLNLKDPRSRHLSLEGRKSNIFAQIAETIWVMAGNDRIDPLLSFFLPRAKDFSDDGETWRGAYGPRLYMYNQLHEAVEVFKTDGIHTRQSVVQILLPELDSKVAILERDTGDDFGKTKDRPCNNELVFFTTPNEEGDGYLLNCNVFQRSGDAIWGCLNINVFEWSFLQELMAKNVAEVTGEKVDVGEYTHFVTNLHLYDFTESQAQDAVDHYTKTATFHERNLMRLNATGSVEGDLHFFNELLAFLSSGVDMCDEHYNDGNGEMFNAGIDVLAEIFKGNGVDVKNNLLFEYMKVCVAYIVTKCGETNFTVKLKDDNFGNAVKNSPFCKFAVELK